MLSNSGVAEITDPAVIGRQITRNDFEEIYNRLLEKALLACQDATESVEASYTNPEWFSLSPLTSQVSADPTDAIARIRQSRPVLKKRNFESINRIDDIVGEISRFSEACDFLQAAKQIAILEHMVLPSRAR